MYHGHDNVQECEGFCEYCQDPTAYSFFEDPHFDTDTESEYEGGDPYYEDMLSAAYLEYRAGLEAKTGSSVTAKITPANAMEKR